MEVVMMGGYGYGNGWMWIWPLLVLVGLVILGVVAVRMTQGRSSGGPGAPAPDRISDVCAGLLALTPYDPHTDGLPAQADALDAVRLLTGGGPADPQRAPALPVVLPAGPRRLLRHLRPAARRRRGRRRLDPAGRGGGRRPRHHLPGRGGQLCGWGDLGRSPPAARAGRIAR